MTAISAFPPFFLPGSTAHDEKDGGNIKNGNLFFIVFLPSINRYLSYRGDY